MYIMLAPALTTYCTSLSCAPTLTNGSTWIHPQRSTNGIRAGHFPPDNHAWPIPRSTLKPTRYFLQWVAIPCARHTLEGTLRDPYTKSFNKEVTVPRERWNITRDPIRECVEVIYVDTFTKVSVRKAVFEELHASINESERLLLDDSTDLSRPLQ